MPTPRVNKQLVDQLDPYFQRRKEAQFAWKSAVSAFAALPAKRGLWTMADVAYTNPQVIDASNQANHLTNNNVATFGATGLIPHVTLNGTNQNLNRTDGGAANWADVTGTEASVDAGLRGLTFGGWFKFAALDGATETLISKWAAVGNYSYIINRGGGTAIPRVAVSVDGTAVTILSSTTSVTTTEWQFIVARFTPSAELAIFVNSATPTTLAVGIPAAVFDSNASFVIGNDATVVTPFEGKCSLCFLCAAALSNGTIAALFEQSRAMLGV